MIRFANGIRFATTADDLTALLTEKALASVALEQVLIATEGAKPTAVLVLFDAGHRVLFVDNLSVLPSAKHGTAMRLLEALVAYCHDRGITDFYFTSTSPSLHLLASLYGATFTETRYLAYVPVPKPRSAYAYSI